MKRSELKQIIREVIEESNDMETGSTSKSNKKLEAATGFPYVMFYLSTQAENILVDFKDPGHIKLIELLDEQKDIIDEGEALSPAEISRGKTLFKKVLGERVSYSKYDGPDCSYRLTNQPTIDFKSPKFKSKWFNEKLSEFI